MPKHHDAAALAAFQQRIGYRFKRLNLLERALTHRSADDCHMERLEFLGDAVLGLVVAAALHDRFAQASEGELSRMRAALVRKESLFKVARIWGLDSLVHVGESQKSERSIRSSSIAANAVEAVIGAVFEDGGWQPASRLVLDEWHAMIDGIDVESARDPKSQLQEYTQGQGWGLPKYRVTDRGVGKSPRFEAECQVNGELLGSGRGDRKKVAELEAARMALEALGA